MTLRGIIKDGAVVLRESTDLPEGTEVDVHPRSVTPKAKAKGKKKAKTARASKPKSKSKSRTLLQRLAPVIGKAKWLPADFAEQHDHYIHGTPRRR